MIAKITILFFVLLLTACQPEPQTANDVLLALSKDGLPIGESLEFTAVSDPNELLGRPGGYTSKINFRDTRLEVQYIDEFDTIDGGSIEVFASEGDATNRREYLAALIEALPALTEYHYQNGVVLLRLSKRLTPEQADGYGDALK